MTTTLRPTPNQELASQRRPTRFNADFQAPISHHQNQERIGYQATTSRLKSSTLTKPTSRSLIKPPVAASEPSNQQESRVRQPSRLVKPSTVRPTSLALKTSVQTTSSSTKQICSSILPRFSSSTILGKQKSTSNIKTISKISASPSAHVPVSCTIKRRPKQVNDSSNLATCVGSASNLATGETRCLSGRLRNLVAVVHPQHSQRVNSSATSNKPASTCNKSTGKTNATTCSSSSLNANNSVTTAALRSAIGRSLKQENGKVSFNHKDVGVDKSKKKEVHKAERCESKQTSGKRIIAFAPGVPQTCKAKINAQTIANNIHDDDDDDYNGGEEEQLLLSANISTTTEANNLICPKSSNGGLSTPNIHIEINNDDHEQQIGHLYQLSNLSPSDSDKNNRPSTTPPRLQRMVAHDTSSLPTRDRETEVHDDDQAKSNNCYYHDANKPTLTKSPAIYFNRDRAISDRLLPKPMGQQVLSLLMLDVGLAPSTNGTGGGQQICSSTNRRDPNIHQRMHAISRGHDATNSKPHFIDNCEGSFNHDRHFFNRADYQDHEQQCNNYHSMEPTCDLLRPQVRSIHFSNREGVTQRSISLPCSPRASRLRCTSNKLNIERNFEQQERLADQSNQSSQSGRFSSKALLSLDSPRQHSNRDQSYSFCDNLDSHSMASSSCSSLNQCPPALALPNQLHEFGDFIKSNLNSTQQANADGMGDLIVLTTENGNKQKCMNVDKTKLLKNRDGDPISSIRDHRSSKIDRIESCDEEFESVFKKGHEKKEKALNDHEDRQAMLVNELTKGVTEGNHGALLRRQQVRSHSISGQDYHLDGDYQRIKQSYYAQQNNYNSQQFVGLSSANHMQRIASPYQQHQQQQQQQQQNILGRSPSPFSLGAQSHYDSLHKDGITEFNADTQSVRSHLDYMNNEYSDYQQQHNIQQHMIQQQNQHSVHHYQQQQQQNSGKHYASGYVLAPPPANTIVNHNGDQDMAAAAMGPDPRQYNSMRTPTNSPGVSVSSYNVQNQSIIERAMAQVSNSPLRRLGLNATSANVASSSMLNNLTNMHHPMRAGHSSISLASSSFIIEDKLQNEIKKLQSELKSEKEKNEALNSQLNINSSLMAAFEQSLTTLNTRLRQLTTLNEKKDQEIEELRGQLRSSVLIDINDKGTSPCFDIANMNLNSDDPIINSEQDSNSEKNLKKMVENLKRQLIEKDRLLTDTRLEALSAAHQLEQLESKMNGEHSLLINEDDLDEGVMVVNHSPSDSDAITDSAQFSDMNNHSNNQHKANNQRSTMEQTFILNTSSANTDRNNNHDGSIESNPNADDQSNHSSDCSFNPKDKENTNVNPTISQQFNCEDDSRAMSRLIDSLLN